MEKPSYDQHYNYAKLCEAVLTKKPEEKPAFLKSLLNLACIILVLGTILILLIVLPGLTAKKRHVPPENHVAIN